MPFKNYSSDLKYCGIEIIYFQINFYTSKIKKKNSHSNLKKNFLLHLTTAKNSCFQSKRFIKSQLIQNREINIIQEVKHLNFWEIQYIKSSSDRCKENQIFFLFYQRMEKEFKNRKHKPDTILSYVRI